MNSFTRFLQQWSRRPDLAEFVTYWDRLEALVVCVYREKLTAEAAVAEFEEVWPWLREEYERWEEDLRPFWQATKAGGAPTQTDPFRLLLAFKHPKEIPGDWRAMQHLPAAREALNQFIRAQSD